MPLVVDPPSRFAQRISTLRQERLWTQSGLAERVGVSPITIYRWERGETFPSPYARARLCGVFGMNVEELFPELHYASSQEDILLEGTVSTEPPSEEPLGLQPEQGSLIQETVRLQRLEVLLRSLECIQSIESKLAEMKQTGILHPEWIRTYSELLDAGVPELRARGERHG